MMLTMKFNFYKTVCSIFHLFQENHHSFLNNNLKIDYATPQKVKVLKRFIKNQKTNIFTSTDLTSLTKYPKEKK